MSSEIVIQKEIRLCGLRRSGNHAIINWIFKQQKGNKIFENNISPINIQEIYHKYSQRKTTENIDLLLMSMEDYPLNRITNRIVDKPPRSGIEIREKLSVVILRDPLNLFASRLQYSRRRNKNLLCTKSNALSLEDMWIMYAKEVLGQTNIFKHDKLFILYNQWCVDRKYRETLAEKLGLEFTDDGFNEIANDSPGSSFEGFQFQGRADDMHTQERWKVLLENKEYVDEYIDLFRDKTILELSDKIFNGLVNGTTLKNEYLLGKYSFLVSILRKLRFFRWKIFSMPIYYLKFFIYGRLSNHPIKSESPEQ